MNILAVDTAGKTAGVALLQDDRLLYECYLDAGMTHSETILPLIDNCLKFCHGRRQRAGVPSGDALRAGLDPGSTGGCSHG